MKPSKKHAIARLYNSVSGRKCADPSYEDLMKAAAEAEKHRDAFNAAIVMRDAADELRATLERGEW